MTSSRKTCAEYINNLVFDHVETYSLQRGATYEEQIKQLRPEYDRLKVRVEKNKPMTAGEKERYATLAGLFRYEQQILDHNGQFHFSAVKTGSFQNNSPAGDRIKQILQTEVTETYDFLCAPEYRDALVFYNSDHQIVSVLNICLSCMHMDAPGYPQLRGDIVTYDALKKLFIELGHELENPGHSWVAEFEAAKKKYLKK